MGAVSARRPVQLAGMHEKNASFRLQFDDLMRKCLLPYPSPKKGCSLCVVSCLLILRAAATW